MIWRKSSYSGSNGEMCVEVARSPDGGVAARDSKAPDDGVLRFSREAFRGFVEGVKRGEYEG